MTLKPVHSMPPAICKQIDAIFTDIDDTLTLNGRIPAVAFDALWHAFDAGLKVIPVTGRPAGWCDHIARMWPVAAVVGENGALSFSMQGNRIQRIYAPRPQEAQNLLETIQEEILAQVPGCKVAADQAYREFDLAIDFCEEVPPLDEQAINRIVAVFEKYGAVAKVSSIHVNGYFGQYDKLSMCRRCSQEFFGHPLDPQRATFVGDSPNDAPMFRFFPHAVGVANVKRFAHRMDALPAYISFADGGFGFAETVKTILKYR